MSFNQLNIFSPPVFLIIRQVPVMQRPALYSAGAGGIFV